MLERVKATIEKYSMLAPGDRVLTGVSGGPDSVALVHVLKSIAAELGIEIFIAHLNHGFRGRDSDEDAEFVRSLARKLELPAIIESRDVSGYTIKNRLSIQEGAREVRYRFFQEAAKKLGCNKLATGHNANDQAETMLNHFLRGSGPAGLGGIPPVRDGWVIRPLIETYRNIIEDFCSKNGLETRVDKSNLKTAYTRNRIRLELIPYLEKEYNPNLVETLVRTSEIFREEEDYLQSETRKHWQQVIKKEGSDEIVIIIDRFLALHEGMQKRVVRQAWEVLTGSAHNLAYVHLVNVVDVVRNAQTGSRMNLPLGITLTKSYEHFVLSIAVPNAEINDYCYQLEIPGKVVVKETGDAIEACLKTSSSKEHGGYEPDEILIDLDLVRLPLNIRNRRPGDWFKPVGFDGSKKLKKFLIDSKIPRKDRELLPIVVFGDGKIVWVAGLRADRRWLANSDTKQVLQLKLIRNLQKPN